MEKYFYEKPVSIKISIEGGTLSEEFVSTTLADVNYGTRFIKRLDDHTLLVESYTPLRLLGAFKR